MTVLDIMSTMESVRQAMMSHSSALCSIALALGSFLLVVSMVRISKDLVSDEQSAGLGGIKPMQIIRPIIMVCLIGSYSYIIGGVDSFCNTISSGIKVGIVTTQDTGLGNTIDAYEAAISAKGSKQWKKEKKEEYKAGLEAEGYDEGEIKTMLKDYKKALRAYVAGDRKLTQQNSIVAITCSKIFDTSFALVQAFAQIYLCLFALFGPFVLAFSVIERWKELPLTWFGQYFETSMWVVVASVVVWIVQSAKYGAAALSKESASAILNNADKSADTITTSDLITVSSSIYASTVISIAGVIIMFSIPAITTKIFNLTSGAVGNANDGTKPASDVTTAPEKAMGSIGKIFLQNKLGK